MKEKECIHGWEWGQCARKCKPFMAIEPPNWYKKAEEIYNLHNLRIKEHGQRIRGEGWSFRKTGEELKLSHITVYKLYRAYVLCIHYPKFKEVGRNTIIKYTTQSEFAPLLKLEK